MQICVLSMALKRLDKDLRSKLRSAVSVSSFSQCIQELVENSIDAGANTIVVHVNLLNFKIKVSLFIWCCVLCGSVQMQSECTNCVHCVNPHVVCNTQPVQYCIFVVTVRRNL